MAVKVNGSGKPGAIDKEVLAELDRGVARQLDVPDGKYTIMAPYIDYSPSPLGAHAANAKKDVCSLRLILQNAEGQTYCLTYTVDHYMGDMLGNLEYLVGKEVEVKGLFITNGNAKSTALLRVTDGSIDDHNKLSPLWSHTATQRIEFLEAVGLDHMVNLEKGGSYMITGVETRTAVNPTTMEERYFVEVGLNVLPPKDRRVSAPDNAGGTEPERTTKLLIYFTSGPGFGSEVRRTNEFFSYMQGTEINPKETVPTIMNLDRMDPLFDAVANREPFLKKGELYVLDSVESIGNDVVRLNAHRIEDHDAFDKEVWEKDGGATPEQRKELDERRKSATISVDMRTYMDSERGTDAWTHLRTQGEMHGYLEKHVEKYYDRSSTSVFMVSANVYPGSLDYRQVPIREYAPAPQGAFMFDKVDAGSNESIERLRAYLARSYMGRAADFGQDDD